MCTCEIYILNKKVSKCSYYLFTVRNCAPKAFCLKQYVIAVDMVRLIFYAVFVLLQKHSTTIKQ